MSEWVIAEWGDEDGERVRAPSYQSSNGVWYRAGVADAGGPTIIRMDCEPIDITKIQGAEPQRRAENHDLGGAVAILMDRQDRMNEMLLRHSERVQDAILRIETALLTRGAPPAHSHSRNFLPNPFLPYPENLPSDMYASGLKTQTMSSANRPGHAHEFVIPNLADEVQKR